MPCEHRLLHHGGRPTTTKEKYTKDNNKSGAKEATTEEEKKRIRDPKSEWLRPCLRKRWKSQAYGEDRPPRLVSLAPLKTESWHEIEFRWWKTLQWFFFLLLLPPAGYWLPARSITCMRSSFYLICTVRANPVAHHLNARVPRSLALQFNG